MAQEIPFCDNIKDIRIINHEMVKSLTDGTSSKKKFSLTQESLEKSLGCFKYSGNNKKISPFVENYRLPAIISSFYDHVFEEESVPNESQLSKKYLNTFFEKQDNTNFILRERYQDTKRFGHNFNGYHLLPRILRAYPSLIRDIHFYTICLACPLFSKVVYSLKYDFYKGLDLGLRYKDRSFFVSLHVETSRGNSYKAKKYSRHSYEGVEEVVLEISFDDCKEVGPFFLYTDKHLNKLINLLEKKVN